MSNFNFIVMRKKIFILAVSLLSFKGVCAQTYPVEINETNFPDPNFRAFLLSRTIGRDGWLSEGEINSLENLVELNGKQIKSLKGIEIFKNLWWLSCNNNQLEELDVTGLPNLRQLQCMNNKLTSLDVSQNPELIELRIQGNKISSIDVSHNLQLQFLNVIGNGINSLDLTYNTNLGQLMAGSNNLTSLDVSNNQKLTKLYFNNNKVNSIDLTNNPILADIECMNNEITSLDFSNNPKLSIVKCSGNHLTSLDLSNNPSLIGLQCEGQTKIIDLEPTDANHQQVGMEIIPSWDGLEIDFSTFANLNVNGTATPILKAVKDGKPYLVVKDAASTTSDADLYNKKITYNQVVPVHPSCRIPAPRKTMDVTITSYPYVMFVNPNSESIRGTYYSGTIVLDYDAVVPEDAEAYIITGLSTTKREMLYNGEKHTFEQLKMEKIGEAGDVIPANTPIYVKAPTMSGLYSFSRNLLGVTPVTVPSGNLLMGSATNSVTVDSYSILTLGREKTTREVGFWQFSGTQSAPHRCYLPITLLRGSTYNGAKGAMLYFGEYDGFNGTTGVGHVHMGTNCTDESSYYTIDGRKLYGKPSQKGIYILNGRKEVIK